VLQVVAICALPLAVWVAALRSDWAEPVARYIIEEGLPGTLRVAAASVIGSTLIGVVLGTLITIDFRPSRWLIRLYIELFRGLPILVTVFIVFFGLPAVWRSLEFDALTAATIALILWGSAQVAEATRGAVQSIPPEQHEAASALGFGWVGRHRAVILPQALRRLLPPLVGLLVNLVQNSTLAQVIGGLEVLEAAERQNERITAIPPIGLGEIHAFEIFGAVMVLFFVISFPLTRLAAMLERRLV
jgi:polar amino acid transport system permease protein